MFTVMCVDTSLYFKDHLSITSVYSKNVQTQIYLELLGIFFQYAKIVLL